MVRVNLSRSLGIAGLLLAWLAVGCGNKAAHSGLMDGDADGGSGNLGTGNVGNEPNSMDCGTPQEGCACDTEGEVVDCGHVARHSGDYTACSMGTRVCSDGKWGAVSYTHLTLPTKRIV